MMNRKHTLAVALVSGLLVSGATLAKGGWQHQELLGHGYSQQREFNTDEIAILVQARLLRRGNPNLKLGKVTKTQDGFSATIVTKKEASLVNTIQLDKFGRPADGRMMKKQMKQRRAKGDCTRMDSEMMAEAGWDKPTIVRHKIKPRHATHSKQKLNKQQIETLVEAKLIRRGNPNVKLGKVTEVGENFAVTIVTQDDALVRELTLNPAGFHIARN